LQLHAQATTDMATSTLKKNNNHQRPKYNGLLHGS
jgi:hypothetical protein